MSGESLIDVGSTIDATDDQIRALTAGYTRKGQGQSGRTSSIGVITNSLLTNALISDRDIIKNRFAALRKEKNQ